MIKRGLSQPRPFPIYVHSRMAVAGKVEFFFFAYLNCENLPTLSQKLEKYIKKKFH